MEGHYEENQPVQKSGQNKQQIDFYRQQQQNTNKIQLDTIGYDKDYYEEIGRGTAIASDNQNFRLEYDHKLTQNLKQTGNDRMKEEYKKMMQDNKSGGMKRRSVENTDTFSSNRQHEARQFQNGAKSALNNYPNQQQTQYNPQIIGQPQLKQINKNKIEKDFLMDNANNGNQQQIIQNSNSISQQQLQKRSLAKSQSQNRLVLVSHETIMNKGNNYPDMYINAEGSGQDKNSFSEIPNNRSNNQLQDLLYKQHLQNSTNNKSHNHQLKALLLKAQNNKNLLSQISTNNCTYCNKTMYPQSSLPPQCSAIYCAKDSIGMMMQNDLSKKYSTNRDYYNLKIVNDLIYNENTHIVSIFKDYLILDDINEFLKRSYTTSETKVRLPKLCSFYDKYSQVFPNYVILPESKYMFKNIQRKQKLIDEQYQIQEELAKKLHQTLQDDDKLFNSKFYNSVYRMDISMSRQQYEDQAKSIATIAGRPQKPPVRIDQMRIDELVDRFLLKDSESNIQLITTAGLDFSGFTQNQSTFLNDHKNTTPNKQIKQLQTNTHKQGTVQQMRNIQQVQNKSPINSNAGNLAQQQYTQKKETLQQQQQKKATPLTTTGPSKKQKGSFTNQQQKQTVTPKIETKPAPNNVSGSTKTTPRIQKATAYTVEDVSAKQQIQTSPATKEALNNYLLNCQIDGVTPQNYQNHIQVIDQQMMESPMMQSPQFNNTQKILTQQQQQLALSQQIPSHTLGTSNSRQMLKSQCIVPTIQIGSKQDITNLKKSTRLSGGPSTFSQSSNKPTPINKNKNISPMPTQNLQSQQQFTSSSRNMVSNSTQKSLKSLNSHAKYLSGGNDQYQRLLQQQNPYATHETVQTQQFGSSSKKINPGHLTKQEILETFQSKKTNNHPIIAGDQNIDNDGLITGEDCDDGCIADERFASPDIFSTNDDNGRKSLIGGRQANPILLTSCDDNRILSQCNNYDQIKKHLEQFISNNNNNQILLTEHANKKSMSSMGQEIEMQKGYNKSNLASSTQNLNDSASRNTTAQKQFESLKHKIRGVFEVDSANKTPNKSSKKLSTGQGQAPAVILQQNRMSIESKDMMQLMVANNAGPLSSTSAAGRTLSFAQFNSNVQNNNYRSITNMQQRKGSKQQESSIENKRLSQNRQSFKEMSQQQDKIKRCATGKTLSINDINQHTFGTIQNHTGQTYLQSIQSATTLGNPTFIQSQAAKAYQTHHQQQNSIGNSQANNNSQSQQAANTVRVMTPSYSLASLSKMISPTTSTSPITMTVTLASQGRKQGTKKQQQSHNHHTTHNPTQGSLVTSGSHQNFLLADKNTKLIGAKAQHHQQATNYSTNNTHNTLASKTTRSIVQQQQHKPSQSQQKNIQTKLQSSGSQEQFQVTPRGPAQQKTGQHENSQNLSCTISTENNSSKFYSDLINIAAKAVESKNPKFMRTIEEYGGASTQIPQQSYNTMLNATNGHRKSGTGLSGSISQAQLDMKQKQKIQTVVNSNQGTIKRQAGVQQHNLASTMQLSSSNSVANFKSPQLSSQQKKQIHTRYV